MQHNMIAAIGNDFGLGYQGKLLWKIPEDLSYFKRVTRGAPLIMGRKTFESIVRISGKPLGGRVHIVTTRDPTAYGSEMVEVAHCIEHAYKIAERVAGNNKDIAAWVIGGAEIYEEALPYTDRLYLTHINATKAADIFFPSDFRIHFPTCISKEDHRTWDGIEYSFAVYE